MQCHVAQVNTEQVTIETIPVLEKIPAIEVELMRMIEQEGHGRSWKLMEGHGGSMQHHVAQVKQDPDTIEKMPTLEKIPALEVELMRVSSLSEMA